MELYWLLWEYTKKSLYSQVDDVVDVINCANKLLQHKEMPPTMCY